ncbi:hypothetical protein LDENG_00107700 [Lucifuga dentata]|nr:hypothetical protein LDENG_00107700 [Lucifuga dentata]
MDKLTIISGCLFLAADIFAIASIANPDWINTGESAGALTVGLVRQCQTIHGRDRTCIPPRLPPEWVTTLFFIIMGIISLTVTCGLLVASHWRREATKYARWIAFTGMILFCMAALIFPIGFYINEVGGQPYKLPNNTVVGSSYVLFVLSIFFTIVGLLFAGKSAVGAKWADAEAASRVGCMGNGYLMCRCHGNHSHNGSAYFLRTTTATPRLGFLAAHPAALSTHPHIPQ